VESPSLDVFKRHLRKWFGGGLGSVTVGLNSLKGLFQPKDSTMSRPACLRAMLGQGELPLRGADLSCDYRGDLAAWQSVDSQ